MGDSMKDQTGRPRPATAPGLTAFVDAAGAPEAPLPPVHLWDPPYCGDIGMEIRADGTWWYQGTPIGRPAMVKLFSRILRKDDDGRHYLVTPVEKVLIRVEVAPFLAVAVTRDGPPGEPEVAFTTNIAGRVVADADHPIRVEADADGAPRPFVRVRSRLDALVTRSCFFDLVELAEAEGDGAHERLVVRSRGATFVVGATAHDAPDGGAPA